MCNRALPDCTKPSPCCACFSPPAPPLPLSPLRLRLSRERPVTLRTHCLASAAIHMRLHAPPDRLGCTAHPSTDATSGPLAWQMCASGGLFCAVVLRAWRGVLDRWHSPFLRDRRRQSSGCWFIGVVARLSLSLPEYQRARNGGTLPPVGSLVLHNIISLTFSCFRRPRRTASQKLQTQISKQFASGSRNLENAEAESAVMCCTPSRNNTPTPLVSRPRSRTPLPPLPLCRAYPFVGTVVHFSINYLCKKTNDTCLAARRA